MATIQDLGKVAYLNKGVYNSETTYEINDVVSFNGSSYVSKTNENRGNLPTNTIYWSIVASKGDKGETGKPFVIEKTYMTIEAMVADYDNMNINDYVMISGNIEEEQNATLWTKTANEVSPYKWEYLADFSGASGITGATPNIIIGNVTEGNQPAVTRRAGSSNENPILDFILKTGPKGDIGDTGNGISSIEKTGTSGLVDTYTITYTDGTTSTFQVTNGEDAEITPEEFEELQNEVNELKDENQRLKATLPTTTGSGENITLNKTAELDFVVPPLPEGNTKQNTTEGYQLIELADFTAFTNNGITFTKLDDGGIKVNGTATSQSYINLLTGDASVSNNPKNITLEADEYYTLSGSSSNLEIMIHTSSYAKVHSAKGSDVTFKESTDTNISTVRINVNSGTTINNEIIYPMLEKGSTAHNFEKYTNGASPNPEYEQEVQVVKGDVEVLIQNKNFGDIESIVDSSAYYGNVGETISVGVNSTVFRFPILKSNKDKLIISSRKTSCVYRIRLLDSNNKILSSTGYTSMPQIINTSDCEYIAIMFDNTTISKDDNIQIEPGSTASSYTPHQEQKLPLNLPVENLWSLNNSYSSTTGNQWVLLDTAYHLDAGTYTISFDATVNKTVQFNFKDANNDSYAVNVGTNATFTTAVPLEKVAINITSANNTISNIQIEPGLKANHYTPYGTTPIELCKIGDYKDYFYKSGSKWYLHKEIGSFILNGNVSFQKHSSSNSYFTAISRFTNNVPVYPETNNIVAPIICTHFDATYINDIAFNSAQKIGFSFINSKEVWFGLPTSIATNVSEVQNWLNNQINNENPVVVHHALANSQDTEITDTTLISQLEAIYNAISYYEQTNISGTSSGINPLFDVEAYQSTKLLLENALDRLELLES